MNIEEALDRLKRIIDITYTEKFKTFTFMYQDTDAIETLLTAYEKEKEKNKKIKDILQKYEHTQVGDEDKILDFYKELKETFI